MVSEHSEKSLSRHRRAFSMGCFGAFFIALIYCTVYLDFSEPDYGKQLDERLAEAEAKAAVEIRQVFGDYFAALKNRDGERAAELLSAATIEYYDQLAESIQKDTKEELLESGVLQSATVVSYRAMVPREELADVTGVDLVRHSVKTGVLMTSIESMEGAEVTSVSANRDHAIAVIRRVNAPKLFMQFVCYNHHWTVDLTETITTGSRMLEDAVLEQSLDEEEFIISMVEKITNCEFEEKYWNPPQAGDSEPMNLSDPPQGSGSEVE